MAIAALSLEVAYLLVAFAARAAIQRVRTGDWGMRRPATGTERVAVGTFGAGLAATFAAPVADVASGMPAADLPTPVGVVGLVLLAGSVAGTFHAQLAMGASWRVGVDTSEQTELVTGGPFRSVRNPIFTFMVASAVGVAMAVPNLAAVAGVLLSAAGAEMQTRLVEEPYLSAHHGERYRSYAAITGRFVPGVGRLP